MCVETTNTMDEKIIIGFIGAVLALILREVVEWFRKRSHRKKVAALSVEHLMQIKNDLVEHVIVSDGKANFSETQYCEIVVGDFLYDLITSNIKTFPDVSSIQKTITFFHHYKINMSTVRSRLDISDNNMAQLTEGTYNNLLNYLQDAIDELNSIANT